MIVQSKDFNTAIASMPLITVLRGIQEKEVDNVANVLIENGITVVEVPLRTKNPPLTPIDDQAIRSINKLIEGYGENLCVVAGTVMQIDDLNTLQPLDVKVCLSPGLNQDIVKEANNMGISFIPGVETFSECMNAISAGAKGLKMFPSFFYEPSGDVTLRISPGYVQYLAKFVSYPIFMSGGVKPEDLPMSYLAAGATGFNIGAQIYQPNIDLKELASRAKQFTAVIASNKVVA